MRFITALYLCYFCFFNRMVMWASAAVMYVDLFAATMTYWRDKIIAIANRPMKHNYSFNRIIIAYHLELSPKSSNKN